MAGKSNTWQTLATVQKQLHSWGEIVFPVRTADFSPFAQSAAAMKPDIVVGHYGAEQNLGVIAALRTAGYAGPYVIAAYGASEATVKQAAEQAGSGTNIYMVSRYAVPAPCMWTAPQCGPVYYR